MYIDEFGIDDNEYYPYAYGPKGSRVHALRPGKRKKRLNGIDALKNGKLIAPMYFTGSCDHLVIITWVQKVLLPALCKGDIVIMDNASFHKNKKIRELIEEAGCELVFLPVRSPDLNPIENFWSPIKNKIRQLIEPFKRDLMKCVEFLYQNESITKC